jgi:hypothetical protein
MKFAYADPPYYGQGRKLYQCPEWDSLDFYKLFIAELSVRYPDGWALSASSPTLRDLLPLCPPSTRVGAWTKPFAIFKPNVNPAYAWEPVLFVGGRKRTREQTTVRDWVSCNITLHRGLTGAKPEKVCAWVIDLLGADPGDTFDDLMPGTGVFGRVWTEYCQTHLTASK